jgi:hypothetical protein
VAESSGRLLPQVTERNEFFLTSAADAPGGVFLFTAAR